MNTDWSHFLTSLAAVSEKEEKDHPWFQNSGKTMANLEDFPVESSSSPCVPRRNLTEAFDGIYHASTPATKLSLQDSDGSPLGVAELSLNDTSPTQQALPHFYLHKLLKRDLQQALVNRVSFYGIVHDINKEATSMAANDTFAVQRVKSMDEDDEVYSPLVMAVNGPPKGERPTLNIADSALIDEEAWLLDTIEDGDDATSAAPNSCPPTFLQAMGEREYASGATASRTQLWKPSRSWWEAKSGKNPWIEPKSHNKRWRYLWPLIHYHKFLAKCIKKLKRNGVDVKTSVTTVAVFLREEVCAVSDHLAGVSLYKSEEWMECLTQFDGWVDTSFQAEEKYRKLIAELRLRPLDEPGDVDSSLLRSQIDDQFLRAMVATRESIAGVDQPQPKSKPPRPASKPHNGENGGHHGLPLHPQSSQRQTTVRGAGGSPRSRPRSTRSLQSPSGRGGDASSVGSRAPPYVYHNGQWWSNGWAPQFALCDENNSVHSTLSGDSFPFGYHQPYDPAYHSMMPPPQQMPYYPPPPAHPHQPGTPEQSVNDSSFTPHRHPYYTQPPYAAYNQEYAASQSWFGASHDPTAHVFNGQQPAEDTPATPNESMEVPPDACLQTGLSPYRNMDHSSPEFSQHPGMPISPFWSHLGPQMHTTLAMTGIFTPHKAPPSPSRVTRVTDETGEEKEESASDEPSNNDESFVSQAPMPHPAQPTSPFYPPYGFVAAQDGYMPPSPATQFMMGSQPGNSQGYYGYNYGPNPYYYASPRRYGGTRRRAPRRSPQQSVSSKEDKSADSKMMTPPTVVRKVRGDTSSDSDATAHTAAESDSTAADLPDAITTEC